MFAKEPHDSAQFFFTVFHTRLSRPLRPLLILSIHLICFHRERGTCRYVVFTVTEAVKQTPRAFVSS